MKVKVMWRERILMNNKIIVLWGFIIFGLVISIYILGISKSDEVKYDEIKDNLKLSVNNYLADNDLWPVNSVTVSSEELIENNYMNELSYENSKCFADVIVTNTGKKYNYEYDITCVYE